MPEGLLTYGRRNVNSCELNGTPGRVDLNLTIQIIIWKFKLRKIQIWKKYFTCSYGNCRVSYCTVLGSVVYVFVTVVFEILFISGLLSDIKCAHTFVFCCMFTNGDCIDRLPA